MLIKSKGQCFLLGTILIDRITVDTVIDMAHGLPT